MDMKVLSISVAAYNVELYLEQTLASFCIPEIMDDIEVLIIDDGSRDSTCKIAVDFQNNFPNTFRYIKKENGGHGSTVNMGIELCTGKYFKVVDGDDWVDKGAFIKLVNYLKDCCADMVLTDFSRIYTTGEKKREMYFEHFCADYIYSITTVPVFESIAMHSITVRSHILKENDIKLTENCYYVDIEYVVYILNYVNSIVYMPLDVYMYRYGNQNQSVSIKNMVKNISMRKKVSLGLSQYITDYKNSDKYEKERYELMKLKVVRMISGTCLVYLAFDNIKQGRSELIEYEKAVCSISEDLYNASGNGFRMKILRLCNHILFPVENMLYRKLKC